MINFDSSASFKCSKEFKRILEKEAEENNMNLGQYIRNVLENRSQINCDYGDADILKVTIGYYEKGHVNEVKTAVTNLIDGWYDAIEYPEFIGAKIEKIERIDLELLKKEGVDC